MIKRILLAYLLLGCFGLALDYTWPKEKDMPSLVPDAIGMILIAGVPADTTAPTVNEGAGTNIDTNGTLLTIAFSEAVSEGVSYSDGDWTLACTTTGPLTVAHSTGDGTSSWGLTISGGPVQESGTDTCTLDWAGTADGVVDGADNDLAAIDPVKSIVNNSTQGASGIARLGYGDFGSGLYSGSQDITVPDNTDFLIIYVSGYYGAPNFFTGADAFTIEGTPPTIGCTAADDSGAGYMGQCFYLASPNTGSGTTIAWTWDAGSTPSSGVKFVWVAYSGVGSVRSSYGEQEAAPEYETTELTSTSGDMISVAIFGYVSDEGSTGWSNATEVTEVTNYANGDITLAEHESTGNVTISSSSAADYEDGGILAVIMVPAE